MYSLKSEQEIVELLKEFQKSGKSNQEITEILNQMRNRGELPVSVIKAMESIEEEDNIPEMTGDKFTKVLKNTLYIITFLIIVGSFYYMASKVFDFTIDSPFIMKVVYFGLGLTVLALGYYLSPIIANWFLGDLITGNWYEICIKFTFIAIAYKIAMIIGVLVRQGLPYASDEVIFIVRQIILSFPYAYHYFLYWGLYIPLIIIIFIYILYWLKNKSTNQDFNALDNFRIIVIAPITEEITFRYIGINVFIQIFSNIFPNSSMIVILGDHFPVWILIVALINASYFFIAHEGIKGLHHFIIGFVFSLIYYQTGNLMTVIILHFIWNGSIQLVYGILNYLEYKIY